MRKKEPKFSVRRITSAITCIILIMAGITTAFAAEPTGSINGYAPRLGFAVNSQEVMKFESGLNETKPYMTKINAPVIEIEGKRYVPIRAFGDALGYQVTFTAENKAVGVSFGGKSLQFLPISKYEDIKNEMLYFSINGNSYAKVENFASLENLKVAEREGAYLYYGDQASAQPQSTVNMTGGSVSTDSALTTNSAINSTSQAVNGQGIGTTQTVNSSVNELLNIQGDNVVLLDLFVQTMKQKAVMPTENYIQKIKNAYDSFYYAPFINPYVPYSYPQMLTDIAKLTEQYPEYIKTGVAGKSVEGRDLVSMSFGNGSNHVYILGSHHAREYISTAYIMKFVNDGLSTLF